MDEGTLNDLLECSVCLDRLDTSSKVLPCQHTFCKKCLEEIVLKHKELRCPECRILVQVKVDELPSNILLMRILEGLKNSGTALPKRLRVNRGNVHPNPLPLLHSSTQIHQHGTPDLRINSNKQHNFHSVTHQPYAKAMYDYASKEAGDLCFKRGDIIILRKRVDNHWYQGESGGKQGVFPLSYVQIITPLPSHIPQCKALYDFRMTNDEEEGCLAFNKSDIINVIRRVDENWAEGKLDGRIGIFPIAFVEMNNLARSLMKLSSNAQPGPSRVAPPTPTTEDCTPLIPTDHTRVIQHQAQHQTRPMIIQQPTTDVAQGPPDSGGSTPSTASSVGSSSTPNVSSTTSSGASTAPSSPASPPGIRERVAISGRNGQQNSNIKCSTPQRSPQIQNCRLSNGQASSQHDKEKRHSFSSLPTPHQSATHHNRHSAEILTSDGTTASGGHPNPDRNRKSSGHSVSVHDVQLPATYVALYPYKPQKADELELKKGSIYIVTESCQDGWYKGTSNRTQKTGVFPGNYVALARGAPTHKESTDSKLPVSFTRNGKSPNGRSAVPPIPPELPPRASSPGHAISSSWHGQQEQTVPPIGRSSSAVMAATGAANGVKNAADKPKERKEKGTVSLMKRLTSMKRSKSPPPSSYSMDNPVFEDTTVQPVKSISPAHPVHVRSGSCPSQLLQIQPGDHHPMFGSSSQRHKHKERTTILTHSPRAAENPAGSSGSSPDVHRHRKSNSLDAGKQQKTGVQTVRERFRCIAPYPPNSEYELELQVNDIIYVHKKRDDGWYKGTQQRTGKTGLFPASFVESY